MRDGYNIPCHLLVRIEFWLKAVKDKYVAQTVEGCNIMYRCMHT